MPTLNVDNIHIGRGEVWVGGTAPAAGVDPLDPTTSALNAMTSGFAAPVSGGTYCGATNGAATLTNKPTFYMVETEQALAPVAAVPTAEECRLEFTMLEVTYTNLAAAWTQATSRVVVGPPAAKALYVGSKPTLTTAVVTLYSPDKSGTGYKIATIYRGFSQDGAPVTFERRKESQVKVNISGLADLTRPEGDQLFQLVWYSANPS